MNKLTLYHYSNKDFKNKIAINFYGYNSFTANDVKATSVKRVFFYTEKRPQEYFFKGCRFLYIAEVLKSRLYDLRADIRGYKSRYNTITELLRAIKQKYNGVIYNIGDLIIVNLFYDVKIKEQERLTD
jgi:hypothetical protein